MKILHLLIFPYFGSGSGTYVRKLAERSTRLGQEVAVVLPDFKHKVKGVKTYPVKMPFNVALTGHPDWPKCKKYSELSPKEMDEIIDCFKNATLEAVNKFKPDVIHIHHASFTAWIGSYIKAVYKIPYIVTCHGTGILNTTLDKRWYSFGKIGLESADYIICVSPDTQKWLLRVYGYNLKRKTRILPGGIDLENYPENLNVSKINKKYNLENKKIVIYVGKLTKQKGVEYLIKAAPKINAEIFILGGGDERNNLIKLKNKLLVENVHFLGYFGKEYITELKQFYSRADVVVVPSIWDEPLGLVVLEAMASNTPVVASNKGGIPLAVKNNYNGLLVRAKSYNQLSKQINMIIDNKELKDKLGLNARTTIEKKFSGIELTKKIIFWYQESKDRADKRSKSKSIVSNADFRKETVDIKGKKIDYI